MVSQGEEAVDVEWFAWPSRNQMHQQPDNDDDDGHVDDKPLVGLLPPGEILLVLALMRCCTAFAHRVQAPIGLTCSMAIDSPSGLFSVSPASFSIDAEPTNSSIAPSKRIDAVSFRNMACLLQLSQHSALNKPFVPF